MIIEDAFKKIGVNKITQVQDESAKSVKEFWGKVVEPLLLPKKVVEEWFKMAKQYINQQDAVFFIRTGNGKRKDEDPKILRRGFLTIFDNDDRRFVYDDNDIAVYMYKLAYDGFWSPCADELKKALIDRTIPIKFTPSCREEKDRSAYILTGKSPKIGDSGYKVSHIVDTGTEYDFGSCVLGLAEIRDKFFPFGDYNDWNNKAGYYMRENKGTMCPDAIRFLKAHFLRLICPLNYILTPKKDLQINHRLAADITQLQHLIDQLGDTVRILHDFLVKLLAGSLIELYVLRGENLGESGEDIQRRAYLVGDLPDERRLHA